MTSTAAVPRLPLGQLHGERRRRDRAQATLSPPVPSPAAAGASSAPTDGRSRPPVCPNCGHGDTVQYLCYWDEHDEWVYSCGFEGPVDDASVTLRDGLEAVDLKRAVTVADGKRLMLKLTKPSALTMAKGFVRSYFCGYRWRQNCQKPICEGCRQLLTVDMHDDAPRYWCRSCKDYSH